MDAQPVQQASMFIERSISMKRVNRKKSFLWGHASPTLQCLKRRMRTSVSVRNQALLAIRRWLTGCLSWGCISTLQLAWCPNSVTALSKYTIPAALLVTVAKDCDERAVEQLLEEYADGRGSYGITQMAAVQLHMSSPCHAEVRLWLRVQ